MFLVATTNILEAVLDAAPSTQWPIIISYGDLTTTTFTGGQQVTNTNGTTPVTVLSAPAASTVRQVKSINVYNAGNADRVLTIRLDISGTESILWRGVLPIGLTLHWSQEHGWQIGNEEALAAAEVTFTPYGSVTSTNVQGAMQEVIDDIALIGGVTSVFGRSGAVVAVAGDYTASQVTNVPAGNIAAVTVQAAVNELDTEKVAKAGDTMTGALSIASAATPSLLTITHTDDGAAAGPIQALNRTSASPAVNDLLAITVFGGMNASLASVNYGALFTQIVSTTAGAESGTVRLGARTNGVSAAVEAQCINVGGPNGGAWVGAATGGSQGLGTMNAINYFDDGVNINTIYGSLALANTWTQAQTINLNTSALPAPQAGTLLHVGNADGVQARISLDAFGAAPGFFGRRANGTNAAKSAVVNNDVLVSMSGLGYGATAYSNPRGAVQVVATETWTDLAQGAAFSVTTTANGTVTPIARWRFEQDGSLIYNGGTVAGNGFINSLGYQHTGVDVIDTNRIFRPRSYTVGTLPTVTTTGIIHCSDLGGGAGLLQSDGTGWTRVKEEGTITITTDADHTFTWDRLADAPVTRGNATLTANRTATLSATGCRNGDRAMFVRLGGGAFNWSIVGGTTFDLTAANQFCTFEFDGTTWNIIDAGRISVASGGGVDVEDENVVVLAGATTLNFTGAGVTATNAGGGQVDITIPGGGAGGFTIGKYVGLRNSSYF